MSDLHCPRCGAKMATRTSEPQGSLVKRWRRCSGNCGHTDAVLIEPAKIIKVLCTQEEHDRDQRDIA